MSLIIAVVIAYLVGSIPTGLWIGLWLYGIDLRQHGSGNLGATNALRTLGKFTGAVVLVLDVFKGLAPVALLPALLGMDSAGVGTALIIGVAAILGHVFSVFVNFKGGKGVATTLGVFLAIAPAEMAIVIINGLVIIYLTGYVSAGAVVGAIILPLLLYMNGHSTMMLFVTLIICAVVIFRHRTNIDRLLAGTERSIRSGKPLAERDEQPIPLASEPSSPRSHD